MKNLKNQSKVIAIAFVLLLTFADTSVALPTVGAQDDNEEVIT